MLLFLFIFFIKFVSSEADSYSKLIENAVYVSNKYYKHQFETSIIWAQDDAEGANDFLLKFRGSVALTVLYDTKNHITLSGVNRQKNYSQTVFIVKESNIFERFATAINIVNRNLRFPVRIVLILENPTSHYGALSTIFEIAWKNNLVDIVLVSLNSKNEVTLSTYFPYSNELCGNFEPVTLTLDENMFPNKFNNLNGCPIRVSVLPFIPLVKVNVENGTITGLSGYDGLLLVLIAQALNATLDVKEASDINGNESYVNGSATGVFRDLVFNKADAFVPAGILTQRRYSALQISHGYRTAENRWIGPRRREITWIKLLLPFTSHLIPLLCVAFILFVLVEFVIIRYKLHPKDKKTSTWFRTFAILLGQTVEHTSKLPLLDSLFVLWIWFCFVVRIDYQGYLCKALQEKILEPPFGLLEDAVKRVEGFGGVAVFRDYYRDTPLENKYTVISVPSIKVYVNLIAEGKRFLLAVNRDVLYNVRHPVQILDKQISSTFSGIYMRPGWSMSQKIDSIIVILVESGLTKKVISLVEGTQQNKQKEQRDKDDTLIPINMTMVSACFYGMCFMWIVCSIIYIMEISYYKLTKYIRYRASNHFEEIIELS